MSIDHKEQPQNKTNPEQGINYVELKKDLENSNTTEDTIVQKLITEIENKYGIEKNKVTPDLDKQANEEISEVDKTLKEGTEVTKSEISQFAKSIGLDSNPKNDSPSGENSANVGAQKNPEEISIRTAMTTDRSQLLANGEVGEAPTETNDGIFKS